MSILDSTTPRLALIESWNRSQRQKETNVPSDWAVRFFSPQTFYVRSLTDAEREFSGEDAGDPEDIWYGAFHHSDSKLFAVSDTLRSLQKEANTNAVQLQYLN